MYWFDQLACASPRLLVWVGAEAEVTDAREILFEELAQVIATRRYQLAPGAAIARLTFTHSAVIDRPVERVSPVRREPVVLSLADLGGFDRSHPGVGLFFEARVDSLSDLVGFVKRKDQTRQSRMGSRTTELTAFARSLHGRGVDRIVGFGDALSFGRFWDGYDLLAELTRTIHVVDAVDTPHAAAVEQAIAASVE